MANPASQLQYLLEMCVGKARKVNKSCSVISPASAGLRQVLDLLYENFGQKHIVVDAHLNSICKGPPVKPDEESLRKLATELTNCQIVMKAWGFGLLLDSGESRIIFLPERSSICQHPPRISAINVNKQSRGGLLLAHPVSYILKIQKTYSTF